MKSKTWWILSRLIWPVSMTLLLMLSTPSGIGCVRMPEATTGRLMTDRTAFVGHWERITHTACSQAYPMQLEFRANGLYLGTGAQLSVGPGWDRGTYEIVNPTQVRISTANDAILTYQFSMADNTLTFVAPDGCDFQYRKVR